MIFPLSCAYFSISPHIPYYSLYVLVYNCTRFGHVFESWCKGRGKTIIEKYVKFYCVFLCEYIKIICRVVVRLLLDLNIIIYTAEKKTTNTAENDF